MGLTTKTIVFTDLADYTKNISQTEHQLLRKLVQRHEAHTESIVTPYGGRLVRNLGDSFMVLFDSATQALHACMELISTTLDVDDGLSLQFRTSAATGDIDLVGDYFIGEAINLSARINSRTPAGEAWFSDRTRLCMNHSEIPWESVGSFDFKGIPDRVECFRAVAPSQCVLPDSLRKAVKIGMVEVITAQDPSRIPTIEPDTHLVLVGFEPGSELLSQTVQKHSSHLTPSRTWLQTASLPTAARIAWQETGRGLVIGTQTAFESSVESLQKKEEQKSTSTVFLDLSERGDGRLEVAGIALPSVPLAGMIRGYGFDLHADGTWNFSSDGSVLRIEVGSAGIQLSAFAPDLLVNGERIQAGAQRNLTDGDTIEHSGGTLQFHQPVGNYAGILSGPAPHGMPLQVGTSVELGREPGDPGFVLPDRGGLDRLVWEPGPRSEKARRAGLTLDRSMMGRRQIRIRTQDDGQFVVEPIHDRIPAWVIRDGALHRLTEATVVQFDELMVMGAYVVRIVRPF